jgi:hypothetical protein
MVEFIAREAVEQIPVHGKEVLWGGAGNQAECTFLSKSIP